MLKKEQLINEIKNIENGLSTPFLTKRGRPPKTERIEDKNKKEKILLLEQKNKKIEGCFELLEKNLAELKNLLKQKEQD